MRPFPPTRSPLRAAALLAVAALGVGAGRAGGPAEEVVPLPPFIVEEATKGPPWRYAAMPGFEILSRCSDDTTINLAQAHYRLHELLTLLLPERLQVKLALPKTFIFYDEALQPVASQEVIATMLRNQPAGAQADEPGAPGMRSLRTPTWPARHYSFMPNLRLWDRDGMAVFAIVREGEIDSDRFVLTPDYIGYLLTNRTPALPPWFASGVLTLYDKATFDLGGLVLRPVQWISEAQTDAVKKDPQTALPLLPLAELLTGGVPARDEAAGDQLRRRWISQTAVFVRWALDGKSPAQHEALWKLVDGASRMPLTEAMFRECFGCDFAAADAQLAAYLPAAVRKTVTLEPAHPLKLPAVALRMADEGEIARIKGDWERLEIAFVRQRTPELTPKYLEQARRTLLRAYNDGERDPRLLAVLGLCECDAGNTARAREFLEAATARGAIRPRASFELARLRFAEWQATAGPDGKMDAVQAAKLLTPLFAARAMAPALPEVYELIADVWLHCAVQPERGHLAVLTEGIHLFPRRPVLVYRTAELCAARGFAAEATELVRLGLKIATDEADRARFTALQEKLASTADPAPPK